MPFQVSPASLVDQRGTDYASLLLFPNSVLPSSTQASGNYSLTVPLNNTIPQIFVVNPTSDNIFRHVNTESAHAAIIGLIYFSMWMGALGWDIVSTIPFDVRVIKETTWSSSFSSIYSIAYLLSRYISLSWLITVVTNSVIMTNSCDSWMKGSTALFSIAISATMLVFCLRTCSIWHMKQKVVSLVVSAWFLVVAFAVLLPVMSYGDQLPTSSFCAWHFNGLYVVGVFGALLLFDLLCLILTVLKLNKAGWRGLLHGLFPSGRYNLDAEDVKTMLVQKTTAFFAIQFLFLITALLVYVLTETYAYRMMNIVASVAVASSMAGRIFRRAWRQTRELAPHNINRPPSYFPAWAEEHRDAAFSRGDDAFSCSPGTDTGDGGRTEAGAHNPSRATRNKDKRDSLDFYVEGEYGPKLKSRSTSSQSLRSLPRTPVASGAARQLQEMEAGQANMDSNVDVASIAPSTMVIARSNLTAPTPTMGDLVGMQSGPAPAYSGSLDSFASPGPHTGEHDASITASNANRLRSADEMFQLQCRPRLSPTTSQSRLGTTESRSPSVNSSLVSFSSLADDPGVRAPSRSEVSGRMASDRDEDVESDDPHTFVMEEKRRIFVASPPLTARVQLNSKDIYDVDSVKAAARLGTRHPQRHNAFARPATASSIVASSALNFNSSPAHGSLQSVGGDAAHRRCDVDGATGQSHTQLAPALSDEDYHTYDQSTPRPKTAPSWPSPSLSPSESVASQLTLMPRDLATNHVYPGSPTAMPHLMAPASGSRSSADDDVLLAFLNTVEQDSRDRSRASPPEVSMSAESLKSMQDEGRPRTARGGTASSSPNYDSDGEEHCDVSMALKHHPSSRGRGASPSTRNRTTAASQVKQIDDARASSAAVPQKRLGTSESARSDGSSSSGARPSTAMGAEVKPFGFGVLTPPSSSRRRSCARSLREQDNDNLAEDEAKLGSVIQQQYAKLAVQAQMPLDPPC